MINTNELIIVCKGSQKNHRFENCSFVYDGNWGDIALVEHQNYHKLLENKFYHWLGLDVTQIFGNHSGRDGKRS